MAERKLKRIMAVSLEDSKPHTALAMYDGENITISHCTPLSGSPEQWGAALAEDIRDKAGKGFAVLVEDRTGLYSSLATPFSFEEKYDERTLLQSCLDWYFSLQNLGNLILDKDLRRYRLNPGSEGSIITQDEDDKGRVFYKIDWNAFGGAHKAILICVAAAVMEPGLSDRYLDEFLAAWGGGTKEPEDHILKPFFAITQGADAARLKDFETQVARRKQEYRHG